MTLTETLFGGLLAVIAVFFACRLLRLSYFWSGILGALLPFIAYLAFTLEHEQSGDVLAIHLVVYVATAAVLGVFGNLWQRKSKLHWGPKLIIGFFVGLVILNAVLLTIATHGLPDRVANWVLPAQEQGQVHTVFPGVVPHDRNKLYEEHQQRVREQRDLGWQVEVQGLDTLRAGSTAQLVLTVRDATGQPVNAGRAHLGFWRMANSKDDRSFELQPAAPGEYRTQVNLPDAGRWIVDILIERGADAYHAKRSLLVDEAQ